MGRVRFVTHQGKQILLVDYTNCTRQALLDILKERERIVLEQPPVRVTLNDYKFRTSIFPDGSFSGSRSC